MLRLGWASVRARRLRSVLVAVMVGLGVGVLGSTIVYSDTARAAFFDDLARGAVGVDVAAVPSVKPAAGDVPALDGPAAVAAVAKVPGVVRVDQRTQSRLALVGRNGRVVANGTVIGKAVATPSWDGFSLYRIVTGRAPAGPDEAGLDQPTAEREGVGVGDQVTVLDRAGAPHRLRLVGVVDFGVTPDFADISAVVLTPANLAAYATTTDRPTIVVAGQPGVDQVALGQRVRAAVGGGYDVVTGADLQVDLATTAAKYVHAFLNTLRVAALVALGVAILVVYNTFQNVVAQRNREHALLRVVGAGRGQLIRVVLAESLFIGFAASVASVLLSLATSYVLLLGQRFVGRGVPPHPLVVSTTAIAVPLVVGVVATVVSAVLPAITASRVSPLAALRDGTDSGRPQRGGLRTTISLVLAAAAVAAGLLLISRGRGQGFDGLFSIVAGALVVFFAVVLVLPMIITVIGAPLRWLLAALFGATGRLATDNARRHPVRSAATATAIMAGVVPMTAFAILLGTAQAQATRELAENFPVDFVLSHATTASGAATGFSDSIVDGLRAKPEFAVVARSQVAAGGVNDGRAEIGTVEPDVLGTRLGLEVREGAIAKLAPGTAAVTTDYAFRYHLGLGDTVTIGNAEHQWRAVIVALYDGWPVGTDVLVHWSDFTAAGLSGSSYLLLRRGPGTTAAAAAAAVDASVANDPLAVLSSVADRQAALADSLGRRLLQFQILLGLAMVIAVAGIANALFLSVHERTAETGVLRAVGLARRQLYGMLLIESVLTALIGAIVGVGYGLSLGWLLSHELIIAYGHGQPVIPGPTILVYVGLAVLGGILASLLPARRAARNSIVSAIGAA